MLRKLMLLAAMAAMMLALFAPAAMANTFFVFDNDNDNDDNDGVTVNLGDEEDESDDVRIVSRNSQLGVNDCETDIEQTNNADQFAFNTANGDDNRQGIAQSGVEADSEQFCGNIVRSVDDDDHRVILVRH